MIPQWSYFDQDFARNVHMVLDHEAPPEPIVSQPTEWDTDNGLGAMTGLRNAMPFVVLFWMCVVIAGYLVFKQ